MKNKIHNYLFLQYILLCISNTSFLSNKKVLRLFPVVHVFVIDIFRITVSAIGLGFLFSRDVNIRSFFSCCFLPRVRIHALLHASDVSVQQPWHDPAHHNLGKKIQS